MLNVPGSLIDYLGRCPKIAVITAIKRPVDEVRSVTSLVLIYITVATATKTTAEKMEMYWITLDGCIEPLFFFINAPSQEPSPPHLSSTIA